MLVDRGRIGDSIRKKPQKSARAGSARLWEGTTPHDDCPGGRRPSAVSRSDRGCLAHHVRPGRRAGSRLDDRGDRSGRQCQRHRSGAAGPAHAGHERGQGRAHLAPPPAGHPDRGHLRARRQHGGAAVLRRRRHRLYSQITAAGRDRRRDPDHPGRRQLHAERQPDRPHRAPRRPTTAARNWTTRCAAGSSCSPTSNGRCWN